MTCAATSIVHDRDTPAARIGERFGLQSGPTLRCRSIRRARLSVTILRRDATAGATRAAMPQEDGWALGVQLRDIPERALWVDGRPAPRAPYLAGQTALYDLRRNLVAGIDSPFHAVHFHLPRAALDDLAEEVGAPRIATLRFTHGVPADDPVLRSLGTGLLSAIERPDEANALFVDHVTLAFRLHVAQTYGGLQVTPPASRGGLAPWQERRAKELLEANLDADIPLATVARECGLSLSYFPRAFRTSVGMPPHRWLLQQRVARARDLLHTSPLSLAEVALACGFADQSHFGRVFAQLTGTSPGAWRRQQRPDRTPRREAVAAAVAMSA
jgi:AraC-like DNA-binding protein